jgi:hypothetical protein
MTKLTERSFSLALPALIKADCAEFRGKAPPTRRGLHRCTYSTSPIVTHLTNALAPLPFPLPPSAPVLISIPPNTGMDPQ